MAKIKNFQEVELVSLFPGPQDFIGKGQNRPWRAVAAGKGNTRYSVVVKELAPRALITEMLGSTLALAMGLPVARPFLAKHGTEPLEKLVFASHWEEPAARRLMGVEELEQALVRWTHVHLVAGFDLWFGVSDRVPHNMLFCDNNRFVLIDFEDGLKEYMTATFSVSSGLLRLLAKDRSEHELYQIRNNVLRALDFDVSWVDLQKAIPLSYIDNGQELFDELVILLKQRKEKIRELLNYSLGIVQGDIFEDETSADDEYETK